MSQFEYTDLNKFFVSIGIFLIGLTFLLPWLFFRENFDLLIKTEEFKNLTSTAQQIILQRQTLVSYFPISILGISTISFGFGIFLCIKGINGWSKEEKLKQKSNQLANKLATKEVQKHSPKEISDEINAKVDENEMIVLNEIEISINNLWILNHWGSDVASIQKGKMIFKGLKTRLETDGSHIDFKDILKIGSFYKVSCFVKSLPNTDGKFQLWCHDKIGIEPQGYSIAIPYATPSIEGDYCSLKFEAKFNTNIRIHLQYMPGNGQIEVSNIKIQELKI